VNYSLMQDMIGYSMVFLKVYHVNSLQKQECIKVSYIIAICPQYIFV